MRLGITLSYVCFKNFRIMFDIPLKQDNTKNYLCVNTSNRLVYFRNYVISLALKPNRHSLRRFINYSVYKHTSYSFTEPIST